jgi:curli biogenesis system outer membrane secretion channel CsgG
MNRTHVTPSSELQASDGTFHDAPLLHPGLSTKLLKRLLAFAAVGILSTLSSVAQKREVLAIGRVEPTASLAEDMKRQNKSIEMRRVIEAMDGHLISALAQTRKFTLVGRSDLDDLIKEQGLIDSGVVDPETGAEKSRVQGAKYRLVTTVDSFLDERIEAEFAGGRKGSKRRLQFSAQAKIYDASTGELLEAPNFQIEKLDARIRDGGERSDARQNDELMPATAREMSRKIAAAVVDVGFPAKVLEKEDKTVVINRGAGLGMKVGDVWNAFGPTRTLTDPDTGTVIKRKGKLIGKVKITDVEPDSSEGELVEDNGVVVGSILTRPPEEAVK